LTWCIPLSFGFGGAFVFLLFSHAYWLAAVFGSFGLPPPLPHVLISFVPDVPPVGKTILLFVFPFSHLSIPFFRLWFVFF